MKKICDLIFTIINVVIFVLLVLFWYNILFVEPEPGETSMLQTAREVIKPQIESIKNSIIN